MGDSVSRYSIVERLTEKKLILMGGKDELETEISLLENNLQILNRNLALYKVSGKAEYERHIKEKEAEIEDVKRRITLEKAKKDKEAKTIEAKIKAVDEALDQIAEISKASVAQSESPENK